MNKVHKADTRHNLSNEQVRSDEEAVKNTHERHHDVINKDGVRLKTVYRSDANNPTETVQGIHEDKVYGQRTNSQYRTPEQMGNFVNSGGDYPLHPHDTKHTDNVRLKHVSVNPQRRFDDSQLDKSAHDVRDGHDVHDVNHPNHPKHPIKTRKTRTPKAPKETNEAREARLNQEADDKRVK